MTTIACDHETMAADSQATSGYLKNKVRKLYEVNGDIIGFCGNLENGLLFLHWYENGGGDPPPCWSHTEDSFGALVLKPDGILYEYGTKLIAMPVYEKLHAIGSGSDMAIGAMEAGATPAEAVKICCRRSEGTGGRVLTMGKKNGLR